MRTLPAGITIILLSVMPAVADGEPCFLGTPAEIVSMARIGPGAVELQWSPIAATLWYEVMRCSAASGPCNLLSKTTEEALIYTDDDTDGSSHLWYRIIAVDQPSEGLCSPSEHCSLPLGKCAGAGICSIGSELCPPDYFELVCGCAGQTHLNPCVASCRLENIRNFGSCNQSESPATLLDSLRQPGFYGGGCVP